MGTEEVAQGLAVKVSGRLLCPLCLDRLPGDAKVMVNQMRALRGMAVTTYRFFSGRHPGLPLYTFTTATLVLAHRRRLVHGEPFEAPPLPPPGSRPRMPSATEAARGDRTGWMAVAGVAVLLITGVVWLVIPTAPAPKPSEPAVPVQPVPRPADPPPVAAVPVRNDASILTALEERLRRHPEEARSIADEAELLRDRLEPRAVGLRNRAETLAHDAMAVAEARSQPAPKPEQKPEPVPAPVEQPPNAVPQPPVVQPAPAPVVEAKPVPQAATPPKPEPLAQPVPTAQPVPPAQPEPKPAKPSSAGEGPTQAELTVVWPRNTPPLVLPDGLPARGEIPWPWPTGEAIHAGAIDPRLKPRRLAIEVHVPGISPVGGVTLVLHPGKGERQAIAASWTDGTSSTTPITIALDGLRWQTVAIPAAGSEALDPEQVRLRLEDLKDLSEQRPFLVGGASSRWDAAPGPDDHPLRLPLLMPPGATTANSWTNFYREMQKAFGKTMNERSFSFARCKVLLPFPGGASGGFASAARDGLAALQQVDKTANGTIDNLPSDAPDFLNPQAGWPADGMGDLDRFAAVALGWRATAWGDDADLKRRAQTALVKLGTAGGKPRRPACLPLLVIGEIDFASKAEQEEIDRRWSAVAGQIAALGIPVIDLRPAQAEHGTKEIQRMAARMLTDALRQLGWLHKTLKP